jgi:glycosyltransferase involved in cell wall biosynthesis
MDVLVSICCITYNHEKYIADALDSFLMQKTDFPVEILIHDDASSDRTADIIKEYEARYPDLIKPIYQRENQYSQGVKVAHLNQIRAQGKYIATCEGDDFWTDTYKLQKQVDYMEKHPECSLCVHASYRVTPGKKKLAKMIRPDTVSRIFTVEEIILGGGNFFATSSLFYPAVLNRERPDFMGKAPVGDVPRLIFCALKGTVYYIDEVMSAYRVAVPGSWDQRMAASPEKRAAVYKNLARMYHEINRYSAYQYDSAIKKQMQIFMLMQGSLKDFKTGELKELYHALPLATKIKLYIKQRFPGIVNLWLHVKPYFLK